MGRLWCSKDPLIDINGEPVQINVFIQDAHVQKVRGPILCIVELPVGTSIEVIDGGEEFEVNGHPVDFQYDENPNLVTGRARLHVTVPSTGNVNIAGEVINQTTGQIDRVTGPAKHMRVEFEIRVP